MVDNRDPNLLKLQASVETWRRLKDEGNDDAALLEAYSLAEETPTTSNELELLCGFASAIERPTWVMLYCQRYLKKSDDPEAHIRLAIAFRTLHNLSGSHEHAEAAVKSPNAPLTALRAAYDILKSKYRTGQSPFMVALSKRALDRSPESLFEQIRYADAVATYQGMSSALPLIEDIRQTAGTEVGRWMLIADFEADWGLWDEARKDFESGIQVLRDDDLDVRTAIVATAGKLGLFDTMLKQIKTLDAKLYSDRFGWQQIFQKGEQHRLSAITDIAAKNLLRLNPSHAEAKQFLQHRSERMLTIHGLFDSAKPPSGGKLLTGLKRWLTGTPLH